MTNTTLNIIVWINNVIIAMIVWITIMIVWMITRMMIIMLNRNHHRIITHPLILKKMILLPIKIRPPEQPPKGYLCPTKCPHPPE